MNLATQQLAASPGAQQKAKDYITQNHVPQLFEALTTGLLHNRPVDPLHFVQEAIRCASAYKNQPVKWNAFVDWKPPAKTEHRPETSESARVRFELSEHDSSEKEAKKDDYDANSRVSSGYRSMSRNSEIPLDN